MSRTALGAHPCSPPRGGEIPSALSCLAMRVMPQPSADHSKIRRTTAACAGLITLRAGARCGPPAGPGVLARSHIVVAIDLAAGDVAASRQTQERVVCPLLCSLALHLGGESGEREHDLLGGRVERALPVVEVVEEPNAGVQDLLDDVGGLDLLSPEPTLFTHDQDLKWRGWPKRVQEPRQPRSLPELGATDAIVHKDVLVQDHPAMRQRIGAGML